MKLFEILNTKISTEWHSTNNGECGTFILDNIKYNINIDTYTTEENKTLIDFGFDREGDINAVKSEISASKVLGAVLNAASPKINSLNPDYILIAVFKSSGLEESRKSLYELLARWFQKRNNITYISEWQETSRAFYKILSISHKPSQHEIANFISFCKLK